MDFQAIIQQQQEQLAVMQTQIQVLLVEGARRGNGEGEEGSREVGRGGGIKIAKPQIFDGMLSKITGFIIAYKLYIRMRMREEPVER